jgi:nicotinate phosphoribosyltransferase
MGIAAITGDYENATRKALSYWVGCFGEGVLGIALTDTFGTPAFLRAFRQQVPEEVISGSSSSKKTFADIFVGVRQDSGDPATFVKIMKEFYEKEGIKDKKTIVFSDSLNIDLCLEYKKISEEAGFNCTFGVGTFLTNDFINTKTGKKSTPLNIVIKLSSAAGNNAIKISDNIGKNTGNKETVEKVKRDLGYVEKDWKLGDEEHRWGTEDEADK